MNNIKTKEISKFLSLILRHSPQTIDLELDENGWADVDTLIQKMNGKGKKIDPSILEYVVDTNDKKRFAFNEDKSKIRASQGHSISIDLDLEKKQPPQMLYHGTVKQFLEAIKREGLNKMARQHVHLSHDTMTATKVGNRRGKAIILTIDAERMYRDGYAFYLSTNGVWLTDNVPPQYIHFSNE